MVDIPPSRRRKRKPRPAPEIDRRAEAPFNGETANRLVSDTYSTTGGKILTTASLRDDPLGRLHAENRIDDAQYQGKDQRDI